MSCSESKFKFDFLGFVIILDELPVDDALEIFQVICPRVSVVDVVGVLPDVDR